MFKIIFCLATMTFALSANASVYDCTGGSFGPLKVEVISSSKIIINEKDIVKANVKDVKDATKKSVSLIGSFSTLGDGEEGFSVDVKVTKYLLNGSSVAYLNTYNKGPDGFYTDSYKCIKR